jgi:phosphoglycolate phosphatase
VLLKNYIFDLDGTLVDSYAGVVWAATQAVATVLPERQLPDLRPFIGPPIDQIFRRALALGNDARVPELVAAYRQLYDTEGYLNGVVYEGVISTLEWLKAKGASCFVVTNKPSLPTRRMLAHLRLADFFAEVCSPDCAGNSLGRKPETVAALLRRHQLARESSLLVGDSMDDAEAAAENGVAFAAVAYGYGNAAEQTLWPIARTLQEFSAVLDRLPTAVSG